MTDIKKKAIELSKSIKKRKLKEKKEKYFLPLDLELFENVEAREIARVIDLRKQQMQNPGLADRYIAL